MKVGVEPENDFRSGSLAFWKYDAEAAKYRNRNNYINIHRYINRDSRQGGLLFLFCFIDRVLSA